MRSFLRCPVRAASVLFRRCDGPDGVLRPMRWLCGVRSWLCGVCGNVVSECACCAFAMRCAELMAFVRVSGADLKLARIVVGELAHIVAEGAGEHRSDAV